MIEFWDFMNETADSEESLYKDDMRCRTSLIKFLRNCEWFGIIKPPQDDRMAV